MTTVDTQNVALALKNYVKKDLGLDLDFDVTVDSRNRLVVASSDFAGLSFPRMFKTLCFANFGSYYNEERNVWTVDLSYRFVNFTMGKNFTDYVSFEFNSDGEVVQFADHRKMD